VQPWANHLIYYLLPQCCAALGKTFLLNFLYMGCGLGRITLHLYDPFCVNVVQLWSKTLLLSGILIIVFPLQRGVALGKPLLLSGILIIVFPLPRGVALGKTLLLNFLRQITSLMIVFVSMLCSLGQHTFIDYLISFTQGCGLGQITSHMIFLLQCCAALGKTLIILFPDHGGLGHITSHMIFLL
jgi:hypothetical protein